MFLWQRVGQFKDGKQAEGVESISCHIICNKGRFFLTFLRLILSGQVCGLLAAKKRFPTCVVG